MGKKGRVFVRGLTSETYGLGQFRAEQLAAGRVRDDSVVVDDAAVGHSGDSSESRTCRSARSRAIPAWLPSSSATDQAFARSKRLITSPR